jgi:putative hydrolase of the HAD superfamily
MAERYAGVLVDLFGTLVHVDAAALSEHEVGGRRVRTTLGRWLRLVEDAIPGVTVDAIGRAATATNAEVAAERATTHLEPPSRERFRRLLVRLGLEAERARELSPLIAREHMSGIADATVLPAAHLDLLEAIRARGGRIAVVTNFDDTTGAYRILRRHGVLERVDAVVVSEAVGLRKPHPLMVRVALCELDVASEAAVMIGDTFAEDVAAARAAGVDAAWIDACAAGVPAGKPPPRYVVARLTDVAAIVGCG